MVSTTQPRFRTADELVRILEQLTARTSKWTSIARFDPSGRWWLRLHADEVADLWIMTWMQGQRSDLHDHGGSAGAFKVLQGQLTEVRTVADTGVLVRTEVPTGSSQPLPPSTVHDVFNAAPGAAISLHAYSPPLSTMTFYEREPGETVARRTVATRTSSETSRRMRPRVAIG